MLFGNEAFIRSSINVLERRMNHKKTTNAITRSRPFGADRTRVLFVQTLQTQHSDRLDFHDVSVWAIEAALQAAYQAGLGRTDEEATGKKKVFSKSLDKRAE